MKQTAAAILILLAHEAAAQQLVWSGSGDELNAELKLSIPGTETIPLAFWCENGFGVVNVAYEFTPADAREGAEVDIVLSAGDHLLPAIHTATFQILIDKSFVLEGQFEFNEQFVDLIFSHGPLTVTSEGRAQEFSLDGAKEVAAPLLDMCRRR